jgi:hypothetical protein
MKIMKAFIDKHDYQISIELDNGEIQGSGQ